MEKGNMRKVLENIQGEFSLLMGEKAMKGYQKKIERLIDQVFRTEIKKIKTLVDDYQKEFSRAKLQKLIDKSVKEEGKKLKTFIDNQKKEIKSLQKKLESLVGKKSVKISARKPVMARKKTTGRKKKQSVQKSKKNSALTSSVSRGGTRGN